MNKENNNKKVMLNKYESDILDSLIIEEIIRRKKEILEDVEYNLGLKVKEDFDTVIKKIQEFIEEK